jgi:hypothetical protein
VLFNTKQSDYLSSIYKKKEKSYNKSQAILKAKGYIPSPKNYDKENKKAIRRISSHYRIISEIQKEPNKNTYLITITKSCDLKLVTELVKKLNSLKKEGYEFDYFSIIEPTKMGIPHIHIKLVVDKKKGFNSKLKKIVSSLGVSFKNIKKQGADMNNYLLKVFKDENYKEYISWVNSLGISLKKAVKKSQKIKINEDLKVSLTKYNKFLIPLIKKTNKFVTLANVREDIDFKTRLYRIIKAVFSEQIEKKKTEINARVLYSNIKQVSFFIFVLVETDLRNNGPGNLLQKMLNKVLNLNLV